MTSRRDLPMAKGERHVRAFGRAGWVKVRHTGGHAILKKAGHAPTLSIPCHSKPVKRGTLDKLIKAAGLTYDEYLELFR